MEEEREEKEEGRKKGRGDMGRSRDTKRMDRGKRVGEGKVREGERKIGQGGKEKLRNGKRQKGIKEQEWYCIKNSNLLCTKTDSTL